MLKRLHVLGHGGFGVVDAVQDAKGAKFARKTFQVSDPNMDAALQTNVRKRFVKEVHAQQSLAHKNIVPIVEEHTHDMPPYYLMPLAQGSLEKDINADPLLGGHYITALMDVLAGLEEMHDLDMYHRDLKPSNILRYHDDDTGENYYAVGDFGFVSFNESQVSSLASSVLQMGKGYYVAPELGMSLSKGRATADIYSVGCILHSMVGQSHHGFMEEIHEDGPFGAIMLKCTRTDPGMRFQSVAALREAILSVTEADRESVSLSKNDLIQALASGAPLDIPTWDRIERYLARDIETPPYKLSNDSMLILRLLSQDRIDELHALDKDIFTSISMVYANWARNYRFDFEFCDTLGSRLQHMIKLGSLTLQTDCIMALLYLGADHNRFYVERLFMRNTGSGIDDKLAHRVNIEILGDGKKACAAVEHLLWSIGYSRSDLHSRLQSALVTACK